jgi:hypothetical protein
LLVLLTPRKVSLFSCLFVSISLSLTLSFLSVLGELLSVSLSLPCLLVLLDYLVCFTLPVDTAIDYLLYSACQYHN